MWSKLQFLQIQDGGGHHFENSIISISQPRINRFRSNLVGRCTSQFPWWIFNKKSTLCKFKMADGCHIENRFLAISRRHIGRSTRNLEQRWRITCRYRSRDQNCNFRKFKMADGRHFENSFISISQPWIIRFRSNLVHRYKFPFRAWKFDKKNRNFANSRWRTDAILKIVFGNISTPYWPIYANFGMEI